MQTRSSEQETRVDCTQSAQAGLKLGGLPERVFAKGHWYYHVKAEGRKRIWRRLTRIQDGLPTLYQTLSGSVERDELDWSGFLLRPDAPRYDKRTAAPGISGVYALATADNRIFYVGQSVNLSARLASHLLADWPGYSRYLFARVPPQMLLDVETAHIHGLQPEMNQRPGAPSLASPHGQMVEAIRKIWFGGEK